MGFSPSRTKPPFCTTFGKTEPQKICHTPRTPYSTRTARRCSIPLPIVPQLVVRYTYKFLIRWWLRSILVLDFSYYPQSINTLERLRRGDSEKNILAGPATRNPYDCKMFRANNDNKKQLCHLLLRIWSAQREPRWLC